MLSFRIRACPERLRLLRRLVEGAAKLAGCSPAVTSQVVIAVNEACMNVIQHAYRGDRSRDIVIEIRVAGADLVCRVTDFAPPADPSTIKPRALDDIRPGGLGTHFMAELMDDCRFGHLDDQSGNYLEMRKRIS